MFLAAGEALVDLIDEGGGRFAARPGGAALNLAVALARLGARAALVCPLSRDRFGGMLHDAAGADGVDLSLCPRVARPTALAIAHLAEGEPSYAFHDEGSATRMFGVADLPALPGGARVLVAGGVSLAREPCGTAFEALWERAGAAGLLRVLDPNIRPAAVEDAVALRARLARMAAGADLVKLSEADLAWWPGTLEGRDALVPRGATLILTRGAEGARGWAGGREVPVDAVPAQVADTVGAGDSFLAALLVRLGADGLRGPDPARLADALSFAARAAAVTVSRRGCDPPHARDLA